MGIKVSLSMHSVREIMRLEPFKALERCAEAGFRYLYLPAPRETDEQGYLYGKSAEEWKSAAEAAGAEIVGGYVPADPGTAEAYRDFYAQLNARQILFPIDYFPDRKALEQKCCFYNEFGKFCREAGLGLLYENHYHEFQLMEGKTVFERLLENTDEDLFSIALNSYWLMRGLVEPIEILKKYGRRVKTIVQQDYPLKEIDKFNMWKFYRYHPIASNIKFDTLLKGNEIENIHPVQCELFCEIGEGIVALQPIIDAAGEFENIQYVMLKQDYTHFPSEYDSIVLSAKNYHSVRGVSWK